MKKTKAKKNPHEFKDPMGRIWHQYGVDFESATGKSFHLHLGHEL